MGELGGLANAWELLPKSEIWTVAHPIDVVGHLRFTENAALRRFPGVQRTHPPFGSLICREKDHEIILYCGAEILPRA